MAIRAHPGRREILRLRSVFPRKLSVHVRRSRDGGFVAEVTSFPGCFTEADTFSELIDQVNDAVRTYFEVPDQYLSYMPTYLPLLKAAQQFDVFPVRRLSEDLKLTLTREATAR